MSPSPVVLATRDLQVAVTKSRSCWMCFLLKGVLLVQGLVPDSPRAGHTSGHLPPAEGCTLAISG